MTISTARRLLEPVHQGLPGWSGAVPCDPVRPATATARSRVEV